MPTQMGVRFDLLAEAGTKQLLMKIVSLLGG